MQSDLDPGNLLRSAAAEGPLQVPGAPFALAARLMEQYDFPAMYLSGAAFSSGMLGIPDVGLFTLTELVQQTTYLTRACGLPLIVDADTGFGEAINVERTVIELEAAGAAAIQLMEEIGPVFVQSASEGDLSAVWAAFWHTVPTDGADGVLGNKKLHALALVRSDLEDPEQVPLGGEQWFVDQGHSVCDCGESDTTGVPIAPPAGSAAEEGGDGMVQEDIFS